MNFTLPGGVQPFTINQHMNFQVVDGKWHVFTAERPWALVNTNISPVNPNNPIGNPAPQLTVEYFGFPNGGQYIRLSTFLHSWILLM
jgi:hypothetical protein